MDVLTRGSHTHTHTHTHTVKRTKLKGSPQTDNRWLTHTCNLHMVVVGGHMQRGHPVLIPGHHVGVVTKELLDG